MDALYVQTTEGPKRIEIGGGTATRMVQTDDSRSTVLTAGTAYTVPSHTTGRLTVYLDGCLYTGFADASATTITFSDDIPTWMQIVVIAD